MRAGMAQATLIANILLFTDMEGLCYLGSLQPRRKPKTPHSIANDTLEFRPPVAIHRHPSVLLLQRATLHRMQSIAAARGRLATGGARRLGIGLTFAARVSIMLPPIDRGCSVLLFASD
ncbi:hypothetical protein BOSE62_80228 [Bosea sp. 62]|nr:hypothetical protein BOSE46_20443 [Bosea sp. 46]VXC43858.1 hypothetical protein BOSE29B_30986 [Bosea sp. 29B]VXC67676.1 hypothetical protein BOSE125_30591 [Bosea sp. 125]VXC97726.1 hypothetical protein BOSE62_80228 [Bosea sp. 62]